MIVQSLLIHCCSDLKLPLGVKSTALQLYDNIYELFEFNSVELACLVLFIAVKIEDIQGNMLDRFIGYFRTLDIDKDKLIEAESKILDHLGFDFNYPNVYFAMYSVYNEHADKIEISWSNACIRLDALMANNSKRTELKENIDIALNIVSDEDDSIVIKNSKILAKHELVEIIKQCGGQI